MGRPESDLVTPAQAVAVFVLCALLVCVAVYSSAAVVERATLAATERQIWAAVRSQQVAHCTIAANAAAGDHGTAHTEQHGRHWRACLEEHGLGAYASDVAPLARRR